MITKKRKVGRPKGSRKHALELNSIRELKPGSALFITANDPRALRILKDRVWSYTRGDNPPVKFKIELRRHRSPSIDHFELEVRRPSRSAR